MAEVTEKFKAKIPASNFYFSTQCNGDKLVLSGLELSQEQAVNLTWLINLLPETLLEIEIVQEES